jgi:ELWxxDGT repeat protein
MIRECMAVVSLLICGWTLPGAAQPALVKDVDPGSVDPQRTASTLSAFTPAGARAVFLLGRTTDAEDGSELWATDGTDGGTERLRTFYGLHTFVAGGNGRIVFFFVAPFDPGPVPTTLWRTDGTAGGTFALARLASPGNSVIHDGALVFTGCPTVTDCEPWTSDGTVGGTRRLRDITPGVYGSGPSHFLSVGDRLYFFATAPDGPGLWQTDLTRWGTRRVARLPPYSTPRDFQAAGSRLFFILGPQNVLWTSDGTPEGTRAVAPFARPGGRGPSASQLLGALGAAEFFEGIDPALGRQLYRTDGTAGGTRRLTSVPPTQQPLLGATVLPDRLLFVGSDGRLWTSGGSRASTHPITGCAGGCPLPFTEATTFTPAKLGGLAFFSGILGNDVEPWVTDGTPEGTRRLLQVCKDGSCGSFPFFGQAIHGRMLFEAAQDLWSSDGTVAGTRKVGNGVQVTDDGLLVGAAGTGLVFASFDESAPSETFIPLLKSLPGDGDESERVLDLGLTDGLSSTPHGFTALGDDVLFSACSPAFGGIYKTRGTPETTVRLTDSQGFCDASPWQTFEVVDGVAYFAAVRTGDYWSELWRTDGTPEGTWQVSQVGPDKYVSSLTLFRGSVVFVANDNDNNGPSTLWASDGTPAGTAPLFDVAAINVFGLATFEDALYFDGEDPTTGNLSLFRSDGMAAGTHGLFSTGGQTPPRFLDFGGQLFIADGDVLWKTDGTVDGTRAALTDLAGETQEALEVAPFGDRLYFMGLRYKDDNDTTGMPTLFRTDGTEAATVPIRLFDLDPTFETPFPYFPRPEFTAMAGSLFFVAFDLEHGGELWRTDGTTAGTVMVSDINPGPASARISGLTSVAGRLFFAADDGEHGIELWTSDGTAAGTRRLSDIAAGPPSSSPRELAAIGNRLYFSADDGVTGSEPWVLPLDAAFGKGKP